MSPLLTRNLHIRQGADFGYAMRYGLSPIKYRPITGASRTGPLQLTVPLHGITPQAWPLVISGVLGMTEINARQYRPPQQPVPDDYVIATVDDSDHLTVNTINAASYHAYTGGGTIQYPTPFNLAGYTARMDIRECVGSPAKLLSLSSVDGTIVLDVTNSLISIVIPASITEAQQWTEGVYDLELVSSSGNVISFAAGNVDVAKEVTRV